MLSLNLSFPLATGMIPNRSANFELIEISENYESKVSIQQLTLSTLEYTFTGTIGENRDEYWDSNEYRLYEFEIKSNQVFRAQIELGRSVDAVFLMLFNGDSVEDIENAAYDLVYYGYSSKIYDIDVTYQGSFASVYYQADGTIKAHIAVFTYSGTYMSPVSYTLSTSIPIYSKEESSIVPFLILIVVVIAIVYYVKSRNKSKERGFHSYNRSSNYNTYDTQQYQPPQQNDYQSQTMSWFCPGCGSKYTNPNLKFCNGCGAKF